MELTFWITPFTGLKSAGEAIQRAQSLTLEGWHANLLLPTHYGSEPQANVNQSLPSDLLVGGPGDVTAIREVIESQGVGFGCWGIPRSLDDAIIAAEYAKAGGFYIANTERGSEFSERILTVSGLESWWTAFWGEAGDEMDGNVYATLVPNQDTFNLGDAVIGELADGCSALALETYGGPNTPEYPYPSLWPLPSFRRVRQHAPGRHLVPILATDNLDAQLNQAALLGHGEVQVWAI